MARDGTRALTQDLTQREVDHQRWADDGGRSPDSQPDVPKTDLPIVMPVRLVYHRTAKHSPRASLFASLATSGSGR